MPKLHWTMGNTVPPVDMKRPRTFCSVTLKDNVLTVLYSIYNRNKKRKLAVN